MEALVLYGKEMLPVSHKTSLQSPPSFLTPSRDGDMDLFRECLQSIQQEFTERKKNNRRYSLRSFAKLVGTDHSLLSKVMRGKRNLSLKQIVSIGKTLKLESSWLAQADFLLQLSQKSKPEFEEKIKQLKWRQRKSKKLTMLTLDQVDFISTWYDAVILEMTSLREWKGDVHWISETLSESLSRCSGEQVTALMCAESVDRLLRLGLLEIDKNGMITRSHQDTLFFEKKIPFEPIRLFHKKILERAMAAVDNAPMEDRQLLASTISLRGADVPRAQAILGEAFRKIANLSPSGDSDEIFQISAQMLRIVQIKK